MDEKKRDLHYDVIYTPSGNEVLKLEPINPGKYGDYANAMFDEPPAYDSLVQEPEPDYELPYESLRKDDPANKSSIGHWLKHHKTRILVGGLILVVLILTCILTVTLLSVNSGDTPPVTTTVTPSTTQTSPTTIPSTSNTDEIKSSTVPVATSTAAFPKTTVAPAGWLSWGAWSECSETCGDGYQTRTRECTTDISEAYLCVGQSEQARPCKEEDCPQPKYGEWTSWGSWSPCSLTCGTGEQERTRVCQKESDDLDCVGDQVQQRNCNEFDCPDCGATCPDGSWNDECKHCECEGQTLQGRTVTAGAVPVDNARISHNSFPLDVVTTSNSEGNFTLNKMCLNTELYITRDDYIPAVYTATSLSQVFALDPIEYLIMSEHPEDKERLEGESVTMCCMATGKPPAQYYEWFHNDILLDKSFYPFGTMLQLSHVTTEDSGKYRCRANNDYSATYSHYAKLTVKSNSEDFCHSLPMTNIKPLPPGCSYEGGPEIDVGTCSGTRCRNRTESDDNQCSEDETLNFCCTETNFAVVNIECIGGSQPVLITVECGCGSCFSNVIDVHGIATSAVDVRPVVLASVYVNNTEVAVTDFNGRFSFSVSSVTQDVTVKIIDPYSVFAPGIRTIDISSIKDGRFYFGIKLLPKQPTVQFDASTDKIIPLKDSDKTVPFGELLVPANSMYSSGGVLYTGTVDTSVTVVDPRNIFSMANCPSELMFENDQGETEPLKSYGMFNVEFLSGTGDRLFPKSGISVGFNLDLVSSIANATNKIKLWSLNPTSGKWKLSGSLNSIPKSMAVKNVIARYISEIDIDYTWYNFDSSPEVVCYSKIKIFDNDHFNSHTQTHNSLPGVLVLVDRDEQTYDMSRVRAFSDDPSNIEAGFCIAHECEKSTYNSPTTGYIFVENEKQSLFPADPDKHDESVIGINSDVRQKIGYQVDILTHNGYSYNVIGANFSLLQIDDTGPYYDWDQSRTDLKKWAYTDCSSTDDSHNHFRFYINKVGSSCPEPFYTNDYPVLPAEGLEQERYNLLTWFPLAHFSEFSVCYIKVHVSNYDRHFFQVLSTVGTFNDTRRDILPGTAYGRTQGCINDSKTEAQAICIEVKSSGEIHDYASWPSQPCCEDETYVTVYALHRDDMTNAACQITEVNKNITTETHNSTVFSMRIVKGYSYGNKYGLYCFTELYKGAEDARYKAESMCMREDITSDGNDKPEDTKTNTWAVKYDCS